MLTAAADVFDAGSLRDAYFADRRITSQRARWDASDPGAPPNACRYCGRHWQLRAGSQLDGHAACIVTRSFKERVGQILRSPAVKYADVAEAIGVTPGIVRSWAYAVGVAGPLSHRLRRSP